MKIYIVDKRKKDKKKKQPETKVFEDVCKQEFKEIKQFFLLLWPSHDNEYKYQTI